VVGTLSSPDDSYHATGYQQSGSGNPVDRIEEEWNSPEGATMKSTSRQREDGVWETEEIWSYPDGTTETRRSCQKGGVPFDCGSGSSGEKGSSGESGPSGSNEEKTTVTCEKDGKEVECPSGNSGSTERTSEDSSWDDPAFLAGMVDPCRHGACPDFGPDGPESVTRDVDGDGRVDWAMFLYRINNVIRPVAEPADSVVVGISNPCRTKACPEFGPRGPIGDETGGPINDPNDTSPIARLPW
jgi:hypothetical protein